jgi:hypothetical protein
VEITGVKSEVMNMSIGYMKKEKWTFCLTVIFLTILNLFINRGYCSQQKIIADDIKNETTDEWFPLWITKEPTPSKEEVDKLINDKDFPAILAMLQGFLWTRGYFGDVPISGKLDERTKQALKEYQKRRGLEMTGDINPETWKKIFSDMNVVDTPIIGLGIGFHLFTDFWDSYITASGTWIFEDGTAQAMPLQTTKILCFREKGFCFVTTARIGIGGFLVVDNDIYEIERWDNRELVTKPLDFACVRYVLRINRIQKTVKLLRTTIDDKDICKGVEKKDFVLTLSDGFDVYWKLRNKKNEAVKKINNPVPEAKGKADLSLSLTKIKDFFMTLIKH